VLAAFGSILREAGPAGFYTAAPSFLVLALKPAIEYTVFEQIKAALLRRAGGTQVGKGGAGGGGGALPRPRPLAVLRLQRPAAVPTAHCPLSPASLASLLPASYPTTNHRPPTTDHRPLTTAPR
jgi:hypothetical protein